MSSNNDNVPQLNNGVGPAVYYGSIAVALFLIICITVGSRLLYKRRVRRFELARDREERIALERRGEAAGLPTYHESRISHLGLPHYTLTYEPPPNVSSPQPAPAIVLPQTNPTAGTTSPGAISPTQENHFHFHFPSLPSLPAALHLRPRREGDPVHSSAPLAQNGKPPSYEHSYLDGSPDDVPWHVTAGTSQAQNEPEMTETIREADEFEEPFVHPEERRRNAAEARLNATESSTEPPTTTTSDSLPNSPRGEEPAPILSETERIRREEEAQLAPPVAMSDVTRVNSRASH